MWGARHSEVTASRVHKNLQLLFFKEKKEMESFKLFEEASSTIIY